MKPGDLEWTEKRLWTRWQIIRRHKEFIAFCDKYSKEFDGDGVFNPLSALNDEVEKIGKRFGLDLIHHYSVNISPNDIINKLVFRDPFAVRFIDRKDKNGVFTPLWDNCHIRLEIDISGRITDAQLIDELKEHIREAREIAGITKIWKETVDEDTLRVYDLYKNEKSPTEIIKDVWPDEYANEFADSASAQEGFYNTLSYKYRNQGLAHWDERAFSEAYGNKGSSSGKIRLYMRVRDKIKRMKDLLKSF